MSCWKSHAEVLSPGTQNVTVYGDKAFKMVIKVKLGQSNRIGVLMKGTDMRSGKIMWKNREKVPIYKPEREALEEINPANTLTSNL